MRYYEVHIPNQSEPYITSSVKNIVNLPTGTKVFASITEADGSLVEFYEIPVVDGKAQIKGRGKHNPKPATESKF